MDSARGERGRKGGERRAKKAQANRKKSQTTFTESIIPVQHVLRVCFIVDFMIFIIFVYGTVVAANTHSEFSFRGEKKAEKLRLETEQSSSGAIDAFFIEFNEKTAEG